MSVEFNYPTEKFFGEFCKKHSLAVEGLTDIQMADAIRQAIASGDFQRNVTQDGDKQAITYIPYREVERLKGLLDVARAEKHRVQGAYGFEI